MTTTSDARQKRFEEYARLAAEFPAELDIDTLSDEELVALVHETRMDKSYDIDA